MRYFQTGIDPYPAFKNLIKTKPNFTREDLCHRTCGRSSVKVDVSRVLI